MSICSIEWNWKAHKGCYAPSEALCYLGWRRPLFVHQEPIVANLLSVFQGLSPSLNVNKWSWNHFKDGVFFVAFDYQAQMNRKNYFILSLLHVNSTIPLISVSWTPLKVIIIFWQLLQDRFSSREKILKCGVIVDPKGVSCPFLWGFDWVAFSFVCYMWDYFYRVV